MWIHKHKNRTQKKRRNNNYGETLKQRQINARARKKEKDEDSRDNTNYDRSIPESLPKYVGRKSRKEIEIIACFRCCNKKREREKRENMQIMWSQKRDAAALKKRMCQVERKKYMSGQFIKKKCKRFIIDERNQ